jgi:hypothetical protein
MLSFDIDLVWIPLLILTVGNAAALGVCGAVAELIISHREHGLPFASLTRDVAREWRIRRILSAIYFPAATLWIVVSFLRFNKLIRF